MSLRVKLLLLATSILLLPIGIWQWAQSTERVLRQQQSELLQEIGTLQARGLTGLDWPIPQQFWYSRPIQQAFAVDGYTDEWHAYRDDGFIGLTNSWGDGIAHVGMARTQRKQYVLVEFFATDRTPPPESWQFSLSLHNDRGHARVIFPLTSAGLISPLTPGQVDGNIAGRLEAAWQNNNNRVSLELAIPLELIRQGLGMALRAQLPSGQTLERWQFEEAMRPIVAPVPAMQRILQSSLSDGTRAWLLTPQGWVLARADAGLSSQETESAQWLKSLAYRFVLGVDLPTYPQRLNDAARIEEPALNSARLGDSVITWYANAAAATLYSNLAIPLASGQAILLLERRHDNLLLLAGGEFAQLGMISVIVGVVVWLLLVAYAGKLALRIRGLRDATRRIERDPEVSIPQLEAQDEIGDLARQVDSFAKELHQHNAYLESLAAKLSHELHTPLAMVRTSLENLQEETLTSAQQRYADRAQQGTERMQQLVRSMSAARRLERSIADAETSEFDLLAWLHNHGDSYQAMFAERQFSIHADTDTPIRFTGSPELLAQMLDKLIDNAVSFTPDQGWVNIQLRKTRRHVTIAVANQGPPLPEGSPTHLFSSMVSRRQNGDKHLGLGLHIVRLIARFHLGLVSARNITDGVEFAVQFPLNRRIR